MFWFFNWELLFGVLWGRFGTKFGQCGGFYVGLFALGGKKILLLWWHTGLGVYECECECVCVEVGRGGVVETIMVVGGVV